MKPFSPASDENKAPILEVLREVLTGARQVLEIGSGTGQHAVYFARHLTHLTWIPSDLAAQHAGIQAWREEARLPNLVPPLPLDVNADTWPAVNADAVFSANTLHILSWPEVENLFQGVGKLLGPGGLLCVYGPFNESGRYTSASNARFDAWLRQRDPRSGLRDLADLDTLASRHRLTRRRLYPMPANNRIVVWERVP